jgi:hypothetical protein
MRLVKIEDTQIHNLASRVIGDGCLFTPDGCLFIYIEGSFWETEMAMRTNVMYLDAYERHVPNIYRFMRI